MGLEAQRAELHEMDDEAERLDGQAAVISARRRHIRDAAKCRDCGAPQKLCDTFRGDGPGPEGLCCWSGRHIHDQDQHALSVLLDEIQAGQVRTVAEIDPPPVLGPNLPGMAWLLDQTQWWYPKRRPAILITSMDKTHRYNTVKWLERAAGALHGSVGSRYLAGAPDEVWTGWMREANDPVGWLHRQPLVKALRKGLPTTGRKLADLQERAKHWSTCPMRLRIEVRPAFASCTCVPLPATEDGRADRTAEVPS